MVRSEKEIFIKKNALKTMMKILFVPLMIFLVSSCSTLSRQEFNNSSSYNISFVTPVDEIASVKVSIGNNTSGNETTMMMVGTAYVAVPTGQKGISYSAENKREYGKRLAGLLVEINAFKRTNYIAVPDYALTTVKESPQSTILIVRFNNIYMGEDGWPTDIAATFTLKKNGKILFEKDYTSSSGLFGIGGCWDCYPQDLAEKKLNKAFFNDLLKWQHQKL